MMYYLETQAIRTLSNKLKDLNHKDVFTSYLVIFELISGIKDEESFNLRKSVLLNIFSSGITIDRRMINEFFYGAFQEKYSDTTKYLDDIKDLIFISNSYKELLSNDKYKKLKFKIGNFEKVDKNISELN